MKTRWPPLPKVVHGTVGPITVCEAKSVKGDDGSASWGTWEPSTRTILIDETAPPRFKWTTLFHELLHATLADAGLSSILTDDAEEALCECIATARVVEMVGKIRWRTQTMEMG